MTGFAPEEGQAMCTKRKDLLAGVEPVARTPEDKARNVEAREAAERLEAAAQDRATRRPPTVGTLRRMFKLESLHTDEAGRWIRGAYALSAREGLPTPTGNDPAEEYATVHREMYGVRQSRSPIVGALPGRRKGGRRGTPLRRILFAVFKPDELNAIPSAVARSRHRSIQDCELLEVFGALALLTEANVQSLADDIGITKRSTYRLIEEARLTSSRVAALETRIARLEDRADVADRRHFTLESDLRNQIAQLLHGDALPAIGADDPRSLEERFSAFVASLSR